MLKNLIRDIAYALLYYDILDALTLLLALGSIVFAVSKTISDWEYDSVRDRVLNIITLVLYICALAYMCYTLIVGAPVVISYRVSNIPGIATV